ncbi:MAG TPA: hypothetical protein VLJ15_02380 [Gammaproteobacteria bacterium]|nr:hypothetical protein [Gammaproteobacteria bacterium]
MSGSNRDEFKHFKKEVFELMQRGSSLNVQINRFDPATKKERDKKLVNLVLDAQVERKEYAMDHLKKYVEETLPKDLHFAKLEKLTQEGLEIRNQLVEFGVIDPQVELMDLVEQANSSSRYEPLEQFIGSLRDQLAHAQKPKQSSSFFSSFFSNILPMPTKGKSLSVVVEDEDSRKSTSKSVKNGSSVSSSRRGSKPT